MSWSLVVAGWLGVNYALAAAMHYRAERTAGAPAAVALRESVRWPVRLFRVSRIG
jgi:hypothetical protein